MSTAYELSGRTAQKQRTRTALVDAARALVEQGETPTVEDAADAASISRTTAYRYFPNQHALLAAAHPHIDQTSLLPDNPPADAWSRTEVTVDAFLDLVFADEDQQRTMLRLSLGNTDANLPLRQGRAIGWLTVALEPARNSLGDEDLHLLVLAIRSAIGVEALVWLRDVVRLSPAEARAQMRWTALTLLKGAGLRPPRAKK